MKLTREQIGFSEMCYAPLDGTRVLLHLPTATCRYAVCRWTDSHGGGWLDDEDGYIVHQPSGFMALHVLDAIAADRSTRSPAAREGVPAQSAQAALEGTVEGLAKRREALLEVAIDFIRTLTGMEPPPIETAPPHVFAPFHAFVKRVESIVDGEEVARG